MSQDNFDASRPIYDMNGSREAPIAGVSTGSVNQDENDTRERAPSLMSIISVQEEDIAGYDDGDSDNEAADKPATKEDAIINLGLNSPRLTILKVYLRFSFQWFPQYPATVTFAKKEFWTAIQFIIFVALFGCYLFDMGAFGNRSLVEEQWKETVTAAKNIIWSLRMIEMYILGVVYFRTRHLEKMLSEVILTRRYWKKAKKTINWISFCVFLFAFVLPVILKAVQMTLSTEKAKPFELKQLALNLSLSILVRIVCLPIFFAFIHVVCIMYSQIRLFKEQIQKWPADMKEKARNRLVDVKIMIRNAERSLQPFLVVHLLLLLVLLIPSIFSFAERFEEESRYEQKYRDSVGMGSAAKIPDNTGSLIFSNFSNFDKKDETALVFKLLGLGHTTTQPLQPKLPPEHTEYLTDVNGTLKLACGALADLLEMIILYSLPLWFLVKLHKVMRSLAEVVQVLRFSEQRENGYLFQDHQILDEMLSDLSSARGVQILRMNLTSVKAAVMTLLMPFLTTAVHLLFLHIHLKCMEQNLDITKQCP